MLFVVKWLLGPVGRYLLIGVAVILLAMYAHHSIYAKAYKAAVDATTASYDKALKVREVEDTKKAALAATISDNQEKKFEQVKVDNVAINRKLSDSLRRNAALRGRPVPSIPGTPGLPDGSPDGPSRDGQVTEAIGSALAACRNDDSQLVSLQDWISLQLANQ